jgi:CRISPR-associated protein Cas5h
MDMLQFTLSGKTAFFKKPEVNTYCYYTYGNIHRVAILGMFGAIMGYGGYAEQNKKVYPEFYEKLNAIKIAIIPLSKKGYIPKKFQSFNNSVGYASNELGGNLIVKEQWLENPKWKIIVRIDNDEAKRLSDMIIASKCTYIPYLGTNDHSADIYNASIVSGEEISEGIRINSLLYKDKAILGDDEEADEEYGYVFKYEEYLPIELEEKFNNYITKPLVHTNISVDKYDGGIYKVENEVIVFL